MAQIGWVNQKGVPSPIIKATGLTNLGERPFAWRSE